MIMKGVSFLKELLGSDTNTSSKRFLGIYIIVVLGTVITVFSIFKDVDLVVLLVTWLGFAGALFGLSEYNKRDKNRIKAEVEKVKYLNKKNDN